MFNNTIDRKRFITDENGNQIVDFTTSIFSKQSRGIDTYNTKKMTDFFQMRPDKVAMNEYKDDVLTEYILKYSGISNPFSLDKDDILVIPDADQASALMTDLVEEKLETKQNQVKLYYKYTNTDFKSDSTSYDKLAEKVIPSGVLDPTDNGDFSVPYISDDGETAITIRNGRMYFGNYKPETLPLTSSEPLQTILDQKCLQQGMSLTDFVRGSVKKTLQDKANSIASQNLTASMDAFNSADQINAKTYQDILDNYMNKL